VTAVAAPYAGTIRYPRWRRADRRRTGRREQVRLAAAELIEAGVSDREIARGSGVSLAWGHRFQRAACARGIRPSLQIRSKIPAVQIGPQLPRRPATSPTAI
jgi:DNA invertase Pin-like site-specific DNA recombinase